MIVIKAGGALLEKGLPEEIAFDIKAIAERSKAILVHGGGREVTEIAQRLGKEQRFIVSPDGFRSRYTDRETVDIYTMVMAGRLNKSIVADLESRGVKAVGLSGLDGHLIRAERKKRLVIINERGRKMVIDGGYTGSIEAINKELLNLLMDAGYVPVISPIAMSEEYEPLNVDGDRAAARIAGELKADALILLTDVEGLLIDGETVPKLHVTRAREILHKVGPGMITKIHAATEAIELGAKEVVIAPGSESTPVRSALNHSIGTVIESE